MKQLKCSTVASVYMRHSMRNPNSHAIPQNISNKTQAKPNVESIKKAKQIQMKREENKKKNINSASIFDAIMNTLERK